MNAIPAGSSNSCRDADVLVEMILYLDPNAEHAHSSVYRKVRAKLLSCGWSQNRFDTAILKLRSNRRLFLSKSRKTMSFKPLSNSNSVKRKCCAYCGKVTKKLTKDHVVPKAQGGTNGASNIVMACEPCNQAKANRTPAEWAGDILNFYKRAS